MANEALFLGLASRLRRLPPFRGKVRALLVLYRALGMAGRHVLVDADLFRPTEYRARLDLHSWLQRLAYLAGEYEADTVRFLLGLLPKGSALLDIGANVGLISVPFAKLSGATVIAVEPVAANWEALVGNAALNGCDIRAFLAGVGDSERSVEIQVEGDLKDGEGTGTANIMGADSTWKCQRNPLKITTVDALLTDDLPKVGLVKIDTDGYDLFAMMGATKLLTEMRPVVFGEFSAHCMAWHHHDIAQVEAFAKSVGYSVRARRSPRGWQFGPVEDRGAFVQDLLLVPQERHLPVVPSLLSATQAALC